MDGMDGVLAAQHRAAIGELKTHTFEDKKKIHPRHTGCVCTPCD
jgi:hypothetical protein